MSESHRIETVEQLRERMGTASPVTAAKVVARLDRFARDFIARSPFLVLSTADADGRQDASPKGDGPGFVGVIDDHTLVIPDRTDASDQARHERLAEGERTLVSSLRSLARPSTHRFAQPTSSSAPTLRRTW